MTTPKQIAYKLVRYARKHPEMQLTVFDISQVPGYRHQSHSNKSVAESLTTTAYAVPIVLVNPYLAGGLFVDYLVRGRYHLVPKDAEKLDPENLSELTVSSLTPENPRSAGIQAPGAVAGNPAEMQFAVTAYSGQKEMKAKHE